MTTKVAYLLGLGVYALEVERDCAELRRKCANG